MPASQTTIRDVPARQRSLPSIDKDVVRIPVVTDWGPMQEATVCVDLDDYIRRFGEGYLAGYYSALAVKEMFAGGTRKIVATRICHQTGASPASAAKATATAQTGATSPGHATLLSSLIGPYAMAHGMTLIGRVDSSNPADNQTATITALAAVLENGADELFALVNGQVLTVKVDRGAEQSIAFLTAEFADIGAATAEEVAAVVNAKITGAQATVTSAGKRVTITSDRKGTGSYIEVTGGAANGVLSFSTSETSTTASNVSNANSVPVAELKTILEAAWTHGSGVTVSSVGGAVQIVSDTTGASSSIICVSTSTGDTACGLDNSTHTGATGVAADTLRIDAKYYGVKGDTISYLVFSASSGDASRFDLVIYAGGVYKETFDNVTMDTADDRYVQDIVNTIPGYSDWVAAIDLSAVGTPTQRRPADTGTRAVPAPVTLSGGNNGLTSIDENDFVGNSIYGTGLYAFDLLPQDGDLLVCPDCTTVAFQKSATARCEFDWMGKCIFVPDFAASLSYTDAAVHAVQVDASEARTGFVWPWPLVANPDKAVYGPAETMAMPFSALYVGRMARNTQAYEKDVWTQPGNQIYGLLSNAVGLASKESLRKGVRDYLAGFQINSLVQGKTQAGSFGVWVDDVQSGKVGGNWESVGEIRGVAHVRKVIELYMETRRTQGNSEDSRWEDKYTIEAYLLGWCMLGVYATKDASQAFYVNTDPLGQGINNPIEQAAKRYHLLVAQATAAPARFVDLQFTRDTRAVESFIRQKMAS